MWKKPLSFPPPAATAPTTVGTVPTSPPYQKPHTQRELLDPLHLLLLCMTSSSQQTLYPQLNGSEINQMCICGIPANPDAPETLPSSSYFTSVTLCSLYTVQIFTIDNSQAFPCAFFHPFLFAKGSLFSRNSNMPSLIFSQGLYFFLC